MVDHYDLTNAINEAKQHTDEKVRDAEFYTDDKISDLKTEIGHLQGQIDFLKSQVQDLIHRD